MTRLTATWEGSFETTRLEAFSLFGALSVNIVSYFSTGSTAGLRYRRSPASLEIEQHSPIPVDPQSCEASSSVKAWRAYVTLYNII